MTKTIVSATSPQRTAKLKENFLLCIEDCDRIGVPYGNIVDIKENTRAKSRWGCCKPRMNSHTGETEFHLEISSELLGEDAPLNGLRETILHEICHTVEGGHGHTGEWLRWAKELNRAYGYNIKRTNSAEDKGFTKEQSREMARKNHPKLFSPVSYTIRCVNCGHAYSRKVKSKIIQHPERYRCGVCSGELKRV